MKSLNYKHNNYKKGSAIITAIGLGTVLLIIIVAVHSFTRYRTQTVINESRKIKALALAEAGLEIALGELYNNSTFITHEIKINDTKLDWDAAKERTSQLEANSAHGFSINSGNSGTLSGKLGDGQFKVRVGNIPYADDETTKTINESKSYVKIESMGIYDKTVRKIIAIVNRRYPTREFLMYDGGVLSLIYGIPGTENRNIFSTGHLYGHEGIEIGRISMRKHSPVSPGTHQELNEISAILSGAGGIFFYSPTKAKFKNRSGEELNTEIQTNSTFPTNGTYSSAEAEKFGEFPEELRGTTPAIPAELSPWIKDKTSGISIPPTTPAFAQYKKSAQESGKGLFFSSSDSSDKSCKYRIHSSWTKEGNRDSLDAVYLDFGSNLRDGNVNVPENGIIYSEKDVVIKGNPKKDITIVSEKNVFVAGDFNQAGDKSKIEQRYGFPQNYDSGKNALTAHNYRQESLDLFQEDKNATGDDFRHHVAATVIGKERVVYDYRSPVDCFENELVPYLKYELAKAISVDGASSADKCLDPNQIQGVIINASDTIEGFNTHLATFTKTFSIGKNNEKSDELIEKLKTSYPANGAFDYRALDDLTIAVWKEYVEDFNSDIKGQPSNSGMELEQGIYQLLIGLRTKMGSENILGPTNPNSINDSPQDYLYYPEMTTNAMFVSCGKQANTFYAGPDTVRYYNEISYHHDLNANYIRQWHNMEGFVHRVFGSETNLRLYEVHQLSDTKHRYQYPPTRRKIYDDTLPFLGGGGNSSFELAGFIVLSWQDLGASKEEFDTF